ncbi:MAG: HAMP domain-containing histidine kinase [Lachnospiraceae bacterium]|nr:HAMP domain-containing histidine kinase [Lachnospiraceae bacterium]
MGKIKKIFKQTSIKTAFAKSVLACIFSALFLSILASSFCQWGKNVLLKKYEDKYGLYENTVKIEFDYNYDKNLSYQMPVHSVNYFTSQDLIIYNILGFLSIGVYPVCFIICIIIANFRFYHRLLEKPLLILDNAAKQIADNNLDFHVVYNKEDELGKLCTSFEKMRMALQENNEELWRQMEERRRLNTAFSHDLRTPLTVLKGQSEILTKYAPEMTTEKVIQTSEMMHRHIVRLESYVDTMRNLQRLEDIEIHRQNITFYALCEQLRLTGEMICTEKQFVCPTATKKEVLFLDMSIIQQVFENLLSNALRFAKDKIEVCVKSEDKYFYLTVSDNGEGFAKRDLDNAVKPFYKTVSETHNEHFGMGLNICKILCEKHGGYLHLANHSGAVITAVFRQ